MDIPKRPGDNENILRNRQIAAIVKQLQSCSYDELLAFSTALNSLMNHPVPPRCIPDSELHR